MRVNARMRQRRLDEKAKSERDDSKQETPSRRLGRHGTEPGSEENLDADALTVCSYAKNDSPISEFESRTLAFDEKRGAAVSLRSLRCREGGNSVSTVVAGGLAVSKTRKKCATLVSRCQSAREPPSIATAAAPVRARPTRKELAFVDASSESCQAPRDRTPAEGREGACARLGSRSPRKPIARNETSGDRINSDAVTCAI